mmetsp:Transcript_60383/g.168718  ORF Transcript_60383/g.168718 Transcript_60383/m.168718 type:complete len:129 (-) Transcript_60383:997-1383(-)
MAAPAYDPAGPSTQREAPRRDKHGEEHSEVPVGLIGAIVEADRVDAMDRKRLSAGALRNHRSGSFDLREGSSSATPPTAAPSCPFASASANAAALTAEADNNGLRASAGTDIIGVVVMGVEVPWSSAC